MYFIVDGKVHIMNNHDTKIVVTLNAGNYFGEIALFSDSLRRTCSVISGSITELYILEKKDFDEIVSQFPTLKERFRDEGKRRLIDYKIRQSGNILQQSKESIDIPEKNSIEVNEESKDEGSFSKDLEEEKFSASEKLLKKVMSVRIKEDDREKSPLLPEDSPRRINRKGKLHPMKIRNTTPKSLTTIIRVDQESEKLLAEYVDVDEFNDEIKLQSRRFKCYNNQGRRFSRITFGQNLMLSKSSELSMQWGISAIK